MSADARPTLTRERVLDEAVHLADTQGIAALTMRSLGASLGVQAMSLYNHVANKDEILDGIVDRVVSEIEVPSPDAPWRVAMHKRSISAHSVLLRHPWATALLMSRANVGPAMLRYVDATLGCLVKGGFSLPEADHAWNVLDSHLYGFTLQKLNFPFAPADYRHVAAAYLPNLSAERYPSMHALTTLVARGEHDGIQDFELGLGFILDGLERLLTSRAPPPG